VKAQTDPKTKTGGVSVGKELERMEVSHVAFPLVDCGSPGSDFTIEMMAVALVEDLLCFVSALKVWKLLNVGVGVVIRRLVFGQSSMMVC
jgi:hypothetical protein